MSQSRESLPNITQLNANQLEQLRAEQLDYGHINFSRVHTGVFEAEDHDRMEAFSAPIAFSRVERFGDTDHAIGYFALLDPDLNLRSVHLTTISRDGDLKLQSKGRFSKNTDATWQHGFVVPKFMDPNLADLETKQRLHRYLPDFRKIVKWL